MTTGNRAFVALVVVAAGASLAILVAACAAFGLLLHSALAGSAGLSAWDILPAFVFVLPVATGGGAGIWSIRSQLRSTNGLVERVDMSRLPVTHDIQDITGRAGLGGRVDVVDSAEPFSFAYGLLRPRVVVSRGLVSSALEAELGAVLSHERYHVANLDPLKVVAARALSRSLFYLPVLRDLHHRYVAGRELAADRWAIADRGRVPLAGALYRVTGGPEWPELSTAAAMALPDLLEVRVAQLETGAEPEIARVSRLSLALTFAVAGVLMWASVASMLAMSRLMDDMGGMSMSGMGGMSATLRGVWTSAVILFWLWVGWRTMRWLRSRRTPPLDTTRT